jgi:hypothetical protein
MLYATNATAFWASHALFRTLIAAIGLGGIGSGAYLGALLLGFLGGGPLDQLLPRFQRLTRRGEPRPVLSILRIFVFVAFGSMVAFVFQFAQGAIFAPIQAFVLGASWPSVVAQILARSGHTDIDQIRELALRAQR